MKKIPFTIIPIIIVIILVALFIFVVPKGGDLISASGDYYLGMITGLLLIICLVIDVIRYNKNK